MVEKIGLEALLKTKEFQKGLSEYLDGLGVMDKETVVTSKSVNKTSQLIGAGMAAAATAAVIAAAAIIGATVAVGAAMVKLAVAAAPLEGIGQAYTVMAGRAGLALDDMRTAAAGTISDFGLMQNANIALAGAGDDLAVAFGENLPRLLEIARASAKAMGKDAESMFQSLVGGVKRSSPLLIDNTGLVLKVAEANQTLADELGIAVDLLSAEQKQIALLNATVAAGAAMVDQFGGGQLTAAENMARFSAQTKNITDTIGLALTPALNTVVGAFADMATVIATDLREGGKLQEVLIKIGTIASLVADGIAMLARKAIPAVTNFIGTMADSFIGAADSAFDWGIDIAVALADGLIQGASAAIIAAMTFIGNLLTSWLAPGSPPRVAPELDKWGAAALTEWLEGMSQADFDVLKAIQGPLKSILSGEEFQQVTAGLIESLGTGDMQDFFAQITAAGGEFGAEIAQLAQQELELAGAIDTVAKAERDLANAREAQSNAMSQVSELTAEYNELLRDNASPEILQAQLDQINAAETQAQVAADQAAAAEETLSATENEIGTLEEQLSLQEQLVNQLLGLADAQDEVAAAGAAGGAAGGAGATLADILAGGVPGGGAGLELPDIGSLLAEKIEEAKGIILEKLDDMLQPVRDKFGEWKEIIEDLGKKWVWFTGVLNKFWQEKVNPILVWINEYLLTPLKNVWAFIRDFILPIFGELANMILLGLKVSLWSLWSFIVDFVLPALGDLWDMFNVKLREALDFLGVDVDLLGEKFQTFKDTILDNIILGFERFKELAGQIRDKIAAINDILRNFDPSALWPFIGQSPSPLEIGLRGISDAMDDLNFRSLPGFQMNMLPATTGSQVNIRNDFGGNNIASGMDMAMLERKIITVVSAAVRNAT